MTPQLEVQTREHILQDCMEFAGKRATLISLSRDIFLPTILETEEGIKFPKGHTVRDGQMLGRMIKK